MSESTTFSNSCPKCGAALPSTATSGLCPRCLMAEAMVPTRVDAESVAQPPLPLEQIEPHFPQLEILECLGRGGMGVVYKARQKTLNRLVALKLLAPERVHDAQFAQRFTREAQALAALNHPNIVTIYDFGQAGGFYYLLMEFVDGVNLRQLLRARKLTPEEALTVVPPLCDALQFAHDRGIIHRDIKPENLLLNKAGQVKIADFGIAKMLSAAPENATQTNVGTPGYSAPEQQTDPHRVDSRADIYSLGVVLYEMLTGELPGKPIDPPSRRVQIDVRLDEVVLRTLEQNPELRYQKASEVKTMLETITGHAPAGTVPSTLPVNATEISKRMRRPTSVTVFGFLNILRAGADVFGAIFVVGLLLTSVDSDNSVVKMLHESPAYAAWMKLSVLLGLFSAVVLLVTGIGLLCLKPWARKISMGFALYAICVWVVSSAINAVFSFQPFLKNQQDVHAATDALVGLIGNGVFGCLGVIYYVLLFVFMLRPTVAAAFNPPAQPRM